MSKRSKHISASKQTGGVPPIAIVVSRYNKSVTDALERGAIEAYAAMGGRAADLLIVDAPGSFEVVVLSAAALRSGRVAGVVALGCIIKGETRHDEMLGHAVTSGLANLAAQTAMPIGLGVLTVNTTGQALARAGGRLGNKGAEAMSAVVLSLAAINAIDGSGGMAKSVVTTARPDKARGKARRAVMGRASR